MTNTDSNDREIARRARAFFSECDGLSTVTRDDEWGDEAFLDAGEATFDTE